MHEKGPDVVLRRMATQYMLQSCLSMYCRIIICLHFEILPSWMWHLLVWLLFIGIAV